jgi:hypothetical protein
MHDRNVTARRKLVLAVWRIAFSLDTANVVLHAC